MKKKPTDHEILTALNEIIQESNKPKKVELGLVDDLDKLVKKMSQGEGDMDKQLKKTDKEISDFIGADKLFYQNLDDLIMSVREEGSPIQKFDASCFDGKYVTEDVTQDYLKELDTVRNDASKQKQSIDISEDVIVY